nr:penicillin acylase family protein [uncultured Roseateles sp.]
MPKPVITSQSSAWSLATLMASTLLLSACGGSGDTDPTKPVTPDAPAFSAEIRYTSYGVPHVKADDFKGAGYGYGYAFANDHICLFAQELVTMRGERSRYFGDVDAAGKPITYLGQFGDFTPNLASDFFYKTLMTPALAQNMKAGAGADIRAMVSGFVAGYNRYLRDKGPNGLPSECKDAAWVRPMTEDDAYFRFNQAAMAGSSMQFIAAIGGAQPPQALLASAAVPPTARALRQKSTQLAVLNTPLVQGTQWLHEHVIGSNGYGLGKGVTQSGAGIVLGNPHFPWWGALRLHQLHLTVGNKYDVMGATLLGAVVPLIGFNKDVAWTHTFSTDNRFTLFQLKLDPADATRYVVDGSSKAMTRTPLSVQALQPDGSLKTIERTLYGTDFGPVLSDGATFAWSKGAAFAIRDANYSNYKLLDQALLNGMSSSAETLRESLATYNAMPWVNTMAADRKGRTLYANYSVAANVSDAQLGACVNSPTGQFLLATRGLVLMDGSKASCNWNGAIASAQRPYVLSDDYIVNANDSHWLPNDKTRLTGFPKIIATGPDSEGMPQGERTRNGIAQVLDRMKGSDGLPGTGFTVANLQQVYQKARFFKPEMWLDEFVAATCVGGAPSAKGSNGVVTDLTKACGVLSIWKKTEGLVDPGSLLFRKLYELTGELKEAGYWRVPFNPADPVYTPRGFNPANTKAATLLADTVQWFADQKMPLEEVNARRQVLVRDSAPIPIPGGRYTFNNGRGNLSGGLYGDPFYGNSYMQFVTFDANGPVAEGMLTYSQSSHILSPNFADQTRLYSDIYLKGSHWAKLPFSEAEIKADPAYRSILISE